jgi:exodeoxyribonuclease VII large subunit
MSQIYLFQPSPPPSWSVSKLTRYLRELLESDANLQDLWVQGEVSNFSRPSSGHLYFTLKDEKAALKCVMWRNAVLRQSFLPRDGEAIEVHGSISVYEVSGQYQLYADLIRPAGEGVLYQEFLRLKARLEAEGLFDPARKRPIPKWPRRIGIVTSPTGAALRDMLNTLRRRYPLVDVILAPTPVQGEEAPPSIVEAIRGLNEAIHPDIILVARGGGSIEDLWAFNDERVARAIAASQAPVITGVGHETDFTIADFAADLRAPTPTAAAELATPNRDDLLASLADQAERLDRTIQAILSSQRWELSSLQNRLQLRSPQVRLRTDRQRLDDLARRAGVAMFHSLQLRHTRLSGLDQRLGALSPLGVLGRGYAVVSRPDGQVVRSVRQVQPDDALKIRISDGQFNARAVKDEG